MEATATEVNNHYNPAQWNAVLEHVEQSYTDDSPTLYGISQKFGPKSAAAWILMNLTALYGTSNNKDPNAVAGMVSFAEAFAPQVKGFKLSELLIFFARYRAGRYDNSYASFDSRRIGNAFFNEFLPKRNLELEVIEKRKSTERVKKSGFTAPKGYTSLTLYQEVKKIAGAGNKTAMEYLQGKIVLNDEEIIRMIEERRQK